MADKLNKLLTGHTITDELFTRTDSTALGLVHDTIRGTTDLEIWTGAGKTGTELTITTDYTVSDEDTALSTEAGVTIYTKVAIVNGTYQNVSLYGNYKTIGDYNDADDVNAAMALGASTGDIKATAALTVPTGWLSCDGSAISRSTYAALYSALTLSKGTFTVTIATPAVGTRNLHGLATGDTVELTTTGALPTGLTANTNYYVIYIDENTFNLATTLANALAGTKINTSDSQSGTHSLRYCPWGISGASSFLVPDLRESTLYGTGTRGALVTAHDAAVLGQFKDDQMQGHKHDISGGWGSGGSGYFPTNNQALQAIITITAPINVPITDGTNGTPRTGTVTRGKIIGVNYVIKT